MMRLEIEINGTKRAIHDPRPRIRLMDTGFAQIAMEDVGGIAGIFLTAAMRHHIVNELMLLSDIGAVQELVLASAVAQRVLDTKDAISDPEVARRARDASAKLSDAYERLIKHTR